MATNNSNFSSWELRLAPYIETPKCLGNRCQIDLVTKWKMELDDYFVKRTKFCGLVKDVLNCEKQLWPQKCNISKLAMHINETNRLFGSCFSFQPEQFGISNHTESSLLPNQIFKALFSIVVGILLLFFCCQTVSLVRQKIGPKIDPKIDQKTSKLPLIVGKEKKESIIEFDPQPGPSRLPPKKIPDEMRKYLPISPKQRETDILNYVESQTKPRQPQLVAYLLEEMTNFYHDNIHNIIYNYPLKTNDEVYDRDYYDTI